MHCSDAKKGVHSVSPGRVYIPSTYYQEISREGLWYKLSFELIDLYLI